MLKKNNIINIIYIFFLSHFFIWILVPSISNLNLPLDTIEALAWGSDLTWGYSKHPPMSALMVEIIYRIFGSNDWAYYMLSQIFVVSAFYFIWLFAREILNNEILSFFSVFLLTSIYFFNFTTPEFNVNVCQLPFWSLTILFCWRALTTDKIYDWILFGLFAGLGFLTKYLFLLLLLGLKFYFIHNYIKHKKLNFKFFIPSLVFLLVISPHLFWLINNNFESIFYALKRTDISSSNPINFLKNPILFVLKQIVILLPLGLIIYSIVKKFKFNFNLKDKKLIFLLSINVIPILFLLLISILTGANIRTMWLTPFYIALPILILYSLRKNIYFEKINKMAIVLLVLFFISPATYLAVSIIDKSKRTDYPGKEIANLVQSKWDRNFSNEISIVIGDEWAAGNLSYHLIGRPKWYQSLSENSKKISDVDGIIYAGNPKILKRICPGIFGTIKPVGYCMIGRK